MRRLYHAAMCYLTLVQQAEGDDSASPDLFPPACHVPRDDRGNVVAVAAGEPYRVTEEMRNERICNRDGY